MYQLPDWESGRFSSKDELLVVILQNFFPFVDLKNYMQLQVLQARRGGSEKRASLSWVEVMRSTSPSLCTRLPRNLWSRSQTFARLNNEHGGLGMSFLQIVAVLFFLVYLFFALCLKQTVMEAEGDVSLTCCYCELTAHADAKEISKEGKPHVHFPCEKCNGRATKNIKNVIEYLLSCARSDFPINCHQK